jgi:hypothetical protein
MSTRDTLDTLARSARQLGLDAESFHARVAAFLADQARAPLPPDVLASALQDRIHETSGRLISATPLKTPAPSPALITSTPAPSPTVAEHIEEPRQPMQSDGGAGAYKPIFGWAGCGCVTEHRDGCHAAGLSLEPPADTAVEGQGLTLPSGWTAHCDYVAGCFQHEGGNARVQGDGKHAGTWWWQTGPGAIVKHAPTMLQAMCAALGIELLQTLYGSWYAKGVGNTGARLTADEAAKDALEAFHARQQKPATPACVGCEPPGCGSCDPRTPAQSIAERNAITVGDLVGLRRLEDATPDTAAVERAADDYERCLCWVGHDSRRASRWCPVNGHAAEWRTLAESTPEFDDWGRGGQLDGGTNGR